MSAKTIGEKNSAETGERIGGATGQYLDLMRSNYENLDRAVWKVQQFNWYVTSIFVPIIFGGLGYLLKELKISITLLAKLNGVHNPKTSVIWFRY